MRPRGAASSRAGLPGVADRSRAHVRSSGGRAWGGRLRGAGIVVAAAMVLLAGCGGGSSDAAGERAAQARSYAAAVTAITQRSGAGLAGISDQADYRDAISAAQSTRDYAAGIRSAATDLERAKPPASVASAHGQLIALYRSTATRMDALATGFESASGKRALAEQAQALSGEVQRYSTRETELRAEIERGLANVTGTTPRARTGK